MKTLKLMFSSLLVSVAFVAFAGENSILNDPLDADNEILQYYCKHLEAAEDFKDTSQEKICEKAEKHISVVNNALKNFEKVFQKNETTKKEGSTLSKNKEAEDPFDADTNERMDSLKSMIDTPKHDSSTSAKRAVKEKAQEAKKKLEEEKKRIASEEQKLHQEAEIVAAEKKELETRRKIHEEEAKKVAAEKRELETRRKIHEEEVRKVATEKKELETRRKIHEEEAKKILAEKEKLEEERRKVAEEVAEKKRLEDQRKAREEEEKRIAKEKAVAQKKAREEEAAKRQKESTQRLVFRKIDKKAPLRDQAKNQILNWVYKELNEFIAKKWKNTDAQLKEFELLGGKVIKSQKLKKILTLLYSSNQKSILRLYKKNKKEGDEFLTMLKNLTVSVLTQTLAKPLNVDEALKFIEKQIDEGLNSKKSSNKANKKTSTNFVNAQALISAYAKNQVEAFLEERFIGIKATTANRKIYETRAGAALTIQYVVKVLKSTYKDNYQKIVDAFGKTNADNVKSILKGFANNVKYRMMQQKTRQFTKEAALKLINEELDFQFKSLNLRLKKQR